MAGGFGAVVMMYLVISHAVQQAPPIHDRDLRSESRLLDFKVVEGEENLSELQELIGLLRNRIADTEDDIENVLRESQIKEEDVEELKVKSETQEEIIERLRAEIEEQTIQKTRLEANNATRGSATIEIQGEGDRQYMTGMFMGGAHILIALDTSASMFDETIVNVLRFRNMAESAQKQSPKWRRAVNTIEWLVANVPLQSRVHVVLFNEETYSVANFDDYIDATDGQTIRDLIASLQEDVLPSGGTNLSNLFEYVRTLRPLPDNLFLIVDGLPTMDRPNPSNNTVTGRQRLSIFNRSVAKLPSGIPVNVILFPLEGDPQAPASYWNLAHITGGTMLSPSRDWP